MMWETPKPVVGRINDTARAGGLAVKAGGSGVLERGRWARMACPVSGVLHGGDDAQPAATARGSEDIEGE
jgi:hypothetical protein